MRTLKHTVDFCVVGGGLSGLCAAVSAARHGVHTALIHDRPVLGGNASSEIRMWISGAHGENRRETGLVEEMYLENDYMNPSSVYSIWDAVLYSLARNEPNLELYLNTTVNGAFMDGDAIRAVKAWQLNTETWHFFEAPLFADCSGDSILAPLTGAEFRLGREAASEFNEDIEPAEADSKTMGMSCLLQARETTSPKTFIPPKWARSFPTDDDLPQRGHRVGGFQNFWWIELGGEDDGIHDTDRLRDELLAIAFGVWDHIKNHGDHGAANWELEWVGFLPGKRESRRYVGDHILTQNDVRAEGRFDDLIAYGGWTMDDHNPGGFNYPGAPTIFHPAPSPFGIPYRCLYSRNIANLMFAGRNISVTHAAMSATRVMATCATLGQAVGTAAAIAVREHLSPREVGQQYIAELQQTLMDDDSWLPFRRRTVPELTRTAALTASEGDPEPLRNGLDRPLDGDDNAWTCAPGGNVTLTFAAPRQLGTVRLIFDSDLNRQGQNAWRNIVSNFPLNLPPRHPPFPMVKHYSLDALRPDGSWQTVLDVTDNHQRLQTADLHGLTAQALRLTLHETWGAPSCRLFSFDVTEYHQNK